MARRVFLHVGSPKTGTTFLQQVLWSQPQVTRDQRLLLPGTRFFDHFRATMDLRQVRKPGWDKEGFPGAWTRLVQEADAWDGDVLVSHELLVGATDEQARRACESFGAAEVHVVVTARDLGRQIPAAWQENVKHKSAIGFTEFVQAVRTRGRQANWFWQAQDPAGIVGRWCTSLPTGHAHVITAPRADQPPDTLWRRFAGVLGVDADAFDLELGRSNASLGAAQAQLLRAVNQVRGSRLSAPGVYSTMVKDLLTHQVLAGQPRQQFGLSQDDWRWAVQEAESVVESLAATPAVIVGDLDELVPSKPRSHADPAWVTPEAIVDAAADSLVEVLSLLQQERVDAHQRITELSAASRARPLRRGLRRALGRSGTLPAQRQAPHRGGVGMIHPEPNR